MTFHVTSLSPVPGEILTGQLPSSLDVHVATPLERTHEGTVAAMAGADLVVGDFSGELVVDAEVVAAMDTVQLFHQFATGYDRIDVDALTAAGIPLTNAGDAASIALAEHVVMTTLALLKSLVWCDRQVRRGAWPQHDVVAHSLVELADRTVGLLGYGNAGRATAARLRPFGCRVRYHARSRRPTEVEVADGVEWAELDELLEESDVLVVLADLNDSTRGMLDEDALRDLPAGSFLVNAARAEIVDTEALHRVLADGHLGGAAIDVLDDEPPTTPVPFADAEHVILTPHVGGATLETRLRMLARTVEVVTQVAAGQLPGGVLNGITRLRRPGG